jgi:large subunit ribosomal protein L10
MQKELKSKTVKDIKDRFEKSKIVILTEYKGLSMFQLTQLRKKLRPMEAEYKVFKNTLINRAIKDKNFDGAEAQLTGATAVVFGYKDAVAPAKTLTQFGKENEKLVIKAGFLDGVMIDAKMIASLAKLPSREVLLARVVGGMQAPIANFVGVSSGILRKFVYALNAVKEQKAKSGN